MERKREWRKDLAEYILYCLVSCTVEKSHPSELTLMRMVKRFVPRLSYSTFHEYLNRLEKLDFLSLHPADKVRNLIEPRLLTYLYALYRIDHAKRSSSDERMDLWENLNQRVGELLRNTTSLLIDYFIGHKDSLERLVLGNPKASLLLKALDQLIREGSEVLSTMLEGFLIKLSKRIFEKYVRATDPAEKADFIAFIDLKRFKEDPFGEPPELYEKIADSIIEYIGSADLDAVSKAWCSALIDSLSSNSKDLEIDLGAINYDLYSFHAEDLRAHPHLMAEYKEKLGKARPEKLALTLKCPNCHNMSIVVKNIFEIRKRWEVECEKCGCKVPLKYQITERFLRWAEESYIPGSLMPTLIKTVKNMSTITCEVMAYKNRVFCGATSTIEVTIEPPHPKCVFELTLIDPDGSRQTYNLSTDDSSRCRWNYTFNKRGVWRIYASWLGDEDHIGTSSKEVKVLVI